MLINLLLKEDHQKKYLNDLKSQLEVNSKIYAWGTGRGAKKLLEFMRMIDWDGELTFIDTNKDRCNVLYEGYRTVSPETFFLKEYDENALVLITCADVGGVKATINSYVHHKNVVVSDLTTIEIDSKETWFEYIWNHISDFSECYELLADEKSRQIYAGLLNYRISRDDAYIRKYVEEAKYQYFVKELYAIEDIVIADCGAYVGDTIENYIQLTQGNYKKIYAFEPDETIFKNLKRNIEVNGWKNIAAYNLGNYCEKTTLRFESPGNGTEMSNHLSKQGNIIVNVDSLDNIIKEKIDLIKMDIEGAEYDALLGCKRLINEFKPVLAICIYHNKDDYFKLIRLIHSLNPDYKLYVRQYAYNDNETIVYAV